MEDFRTKRERDIEERNLKIYTEYKQLSADNKHGSKLNIKKHLAEKYKIYSVTTVYNIIKLVEKQLNTQKNGRNS